MPNFGNYIVPNHVNSKEGVSGLLTALGCSVKSVSDLTTNLIFVATTNIITTNVVTNNAVNTNGVNTFTSTMFNYVYIRHLSSSLQFIV